MSNTVTVVLNGVTYTADLIEQHPGLYVSGSALWNPDGSEFRIRGLNRCHYDSNSIPGIVKAGANAVRLFVTQQYGATVAQLAAIMQQHVDNKQITIPVISTLPNGTAMSGNQSTADLGTAVQWWVQNAATLAPILNKAGILNIANEWGPSNSSIWSASYGTVIPLLRNAGYTCPILIDCGGSGQDELSIANFGKTVLGEDPLGNVIFGYHLYGGTTTMQCPIASIAGAVITLASSSATHPFAPNYTGASGSNSYSGITSMVLAGITFGVKQNVGGTPGKWTVTATTSVPAAPAGTVLYDWGNASQRIPRLAGYGVCVAVMEFGPGQDIGPSPTLVTPQSVVADCETAGLGWSAWAWDDNNLANGMTSPTGWFGMTLAGPGVYNVTADLTQYGQVMVPLVQSLAKNSTIFS